MFDLLQIDTLQKAVNALPAAPEKISLWSLLEKGGWIMRGERIHAVGTSAQARRVFPGAARRLRVTGKCSFG